MNAVKEKGLVRETAQQRTLAALPGPGFDSLHPHDSPQLSVTLLPRVLSPSFDIHGYYMDVVHRHTAGKLNNTPIHIQLNKFKRKSDSEHLPNSLKAHVGTWVYKVIDF